MIVRCEHGTSVEPSGDELLGDELLLALSGQFRVDDALDVAPDADADAHCDHDADVGD